MSATAAEIVHRMLLAWLAFDSDCSKLEGRDTVARTCFPDHQMTGSFSAVLACMMRQVEAQVSLELASLHGRDVLGATHWVGR